MVHIKGIKWERAVPSRPMDNLISTDFPKFVPYSWKFMEGNPRMSLVMAHEYQRLWIQERDALHKKMYPENTMVNVDVVNQYISNFKKTAKRPKKDDNKKPFTMKKFQNIKSVTKNVRPPDDKALAYLNKDKGKKKKPRQK